MEAYCERIQSTYLKFAEMAYEANYPIWAMTRVDNLLSRDTPIVGFDEVKDDLVKRIEHVVVDTVKKNLAGWSSYPQTRLFQTVKRWDHQKTDKKENFLSFCDAIENRVINLAADVFFELVLSEIEDLKNVIGDCVLVGVNNPYTLKLVTVRDSKAVLDSGTLDEAKAAMEKLDACIFQRLSDGSCCTKEDFAEYMFVNGEEPDEHETFAVYAIAKEQLETN